MISSLFLAWSSFPQNCIEKLTSYARVASLDYPSAYTSYDPHLGWVALLAGHPRKSPLMAKSEASQSLGSRVAQEDAYFVHHGDAFVLAGLFDGHRGRGVSYYASSRFQTLFGGPYNSAEAIDRAFRETMEKLQNELVQNRTLAIQGSTAVVSYFDLRHELVYTATLGDSGAMLVRKGSDRLIPLSQVRNWTSKSAKERFIRAVMQDSELKKNSTPYFETEREYRQFFSVAQDAKSVRLGGLNVSEALGNCDLSALSVEPKITVSTLKRGDKVILFSDGLTDQISMGELAKISGTYSSKQLVKCAVDKQPAESDNVTVVGIQIE